MWRWLVAASLVLAGCKAQPLGVHDGGVEDLAVSVVVDFAHQVDLAPPSRDLAMCPRNVPEICDNGCDDDLNGYVDGDDPACSTQLLVTVKTGAPNLSRLVLEPLPHLVALDGNPVPGEAFAVHNHAFSPAAYIGLASSGQVSLRALDGGVADNPTVVWFTPRDVCVFNGELLVVENHLAATPYAKLHRFPPGGPDATAGNEIMPPVTIVAPFIDACASDGNVLYVSRHDTTAGAVSQFVVLDKTRSMIGTVALPSGLPAGYNRCVDFAWTKKSGTFIGLFSIGSGVNDPTLDGRLMAPFGFDGGLGPAIDGGVWHGIGEFLP
jgi:hypothetical protein